MPAASRLRRAEDAITFAHGLTTDQAGRQLAANAPNELPSARPRTLLDIALEVVASVADRDGHCLRPAR